LGAKIQNLFHTTKKHAEKSSFTPDFDPQRADCQP
jgi:hypothetical protein